MNESVTFLAASDNKKYDIFILPFLTSILYHIKNSYCEIYLNNKNEFINNNINAIDILNKYYENRFIFKNISNYYKKLNFKYTGSIVRFLETPSIISNYTYICDIDILYLMPRFINIQKNILLQHDLSYNNIIRKNSNRLTGCMFVDTFKYYNEISKIILQYKNNPSSIYYPIKSDEELLYYLVKKSNLKLPVNSKFNYKRPILGIHTSLNRENVLYDKINNKVGWGITELMLKNYYKFKKSEIFNKIYNYFDDNYKDILKKIDSVEI